jgi:hypothetical protein
MELRETFFLAASEATQWGVYALGALTIIYVVFRPSLKKKKKDPLADAAPRLGLAQQRSVERQMQNLLVEMSEMARQITAQIDTRSARLEVLIGEADEKIAELRRLAEGEGPKVQVEMRPVLRQIAKAHDDRYEEIYGLADEGQSPQEIAGHLGKPRGEVELILALRAKA